MSYLNLQSCFKWCLKVTGRPEFEDVDFLNELVTLTGMNCSVNL